jgi:hypothetical protein
MNRAPFVLVTAALALAVGFFTLKLFSGVGPPEYRQSALRDAPDRPGDRRFGARDGSANGSIADRERRRSERRAAGDSSASRGGLRPSGSAPREWGSDGAIVVEGRRRERGKLGTSLVGDRSKAAQRSASIGGSRRTREDVTGESSHRSEVSAALERGASKRGSDEEWFGDGMPVEPDSDATDAGEEGKLFDPFAGEEFAGEEDRGADEEPTEVDKVEVLDDAKGVVLSADSVLSFPALGNIYAEAGTIDLTIEPEWDGADVGNNTIVRIEEPNQWNNRIRIVKNNQYLRYQFFDNTGAERDINFKIDHWQAGDQHQITASWVEGRTSLYVDGQLVGEKEYPGALELGEGSSVELGAQPGLGGFSGAAARVSDLTIYNQAMNPGDF